MHAFAATRKFGMVDIGTLADIGYSGYNVSLATAVNESGTLIVGWSGSVWYGPDILPVVWTPKLVWGKQGPTITWKIQKLDTTGFEQANYWWALGVNDFGQITGTAWDNATQTEPGVVWELVPGKGWKITLLPTPADYPDAHPVTHQQSWVKSPGEPPRQTLLPRLFRCFGVRNRLRGIPGNSPCCPICRAGHGRSLTGSMTLATSWASLTTPTIGFRWPRAGAPRTRAW